MSITTDELNRIINAKNLIKTKSLDLGIITDENAKINDLATAINNITNLGPINLTIDSEQSSQHIIEPGYTSGGSIIVTQVIYAYYGDLRLPKLPSDSLSAYPYCWIRENVSGGYYDLIMGTTSFYYDAGNSRLRRRGNDTDLYYRIPISTASSATSWGSPVSHSYVGWTVDSNRTAIWSNHDVTMSQTSTEIYLAGTDPIPYVGGAELMSMLEEVL